MKTIVVILMALMLALGTMACTSSETAQTESEATQEPAATEEPAAETETETDATVEESFLPEGYVPGDILISSGPAGGNWNAMGASFSEAITRAGGKASYVVGGGTQNVIAVGDGAATVAFCNLFAMLSAYNGDDPYTRQYTDVVTLMALDTNLIYLLVPANSDITGVADLEGKTVAVSSVGTTAYTCAMNVLTAAGLDPENDLTIRPGSMSEGADLMKDRLIDAFLIMTGVTNSTIMDICTSLDVKILDIDDTILQNLLDMNPGYHTFTLPADSFNGQTEDVNTIASDAALICSASMSDEDAYWITKAIVENFDYIQSANAWLSNCTVESMSDTGNITMHPGAIQYFSEVLGD